MILQPQKEIIKQPRKWIISDKNSSEGESFFKWMHNRTLKRNRNAIITVLGNTGSGKSYACLRIKEKSDEILKRKFDINHVCFSIDELMSIINEGNLKKGDVLILEEAGVNISARDWQSLVNKVFNYLLQTFRDLNLTLLINLPDVRLLDINSRRIMHGTIEMKGINHEEEKSRIAFKVRQHNFHSHKDYWKFIRVKKNGKLVAVQKITLNKPSEEIVDMYEKKRKEFTQSLNKDIEMKLEQFRRKQAEKVGIKPLTEKQEQIYNLDKKGFRPDEVAKLLNISKRYVYLILKACEKKGYTTSIHRKYPKN